MREKPLEAFAAPEGEDVGPGGCGSAEATQPSLRAVSGPPTIPLDSIIYMMKELEDAHRVLDALDLPPGTITERLVARARRWLDKVPGGEASQSHPAVDAKRIIQAAGESVWTPPPEKG